MKIVCITIVECDHDSSAGKLPILKSRKQAAKCDRISVFS